MAPIRVRMVGSGSWFSSVACLIGSHITAKPQFEDLVMVYVIEEQVDGLPLSEIINTQHEDTKYLPGCKLHTNVVANPNLIIVAREADILLFAMPGSCCKEICKQLKGVLKPTTIVAAITDKSVPSEAITDAINNDLDVDCSVLIVSNTPRDVADDKPSDAVLVSSNANSGILLRDLFQTNSFKIVKDSRITL